MNNIVFDMGNVLTVYNQADYIRSYVESERDLDIVQKQVCASVEWICMDRGTMTDEEAIASVCKRVPQRLHDVVDKFIKEFRMKPEECFFVDDSPANIEAGMRFGMKGCVYHQDIEELEKNLKEAGFLL